MCNCDLSEPFITCAECPSTVPGRPGHRSCLKCFANGAETTKHSNDHSYIIAHDNVQIFPNSNWSAREERHLLDLIQQCGFGNWTDIAKLLATKSADECRDHYMKHYFGGIFEQTCGLSQSPYARLVVPYLYKSNSVNPPRHSLETIQSKFMAGYWFARGDFDTPYDVSAESLVSRLHSTNEWGDEFDEIGKELSAAVFRAYNHRLR